MQDYSKGWLNVTRMLLRADYIGFSLYITGVRLSSHLASDSFRASYQWINRETDSSDKYSIYSE